MSGFFALTNNVRYILLVGENVVKWLQNCERIVQLEVEFQIREHEVCACTTSRRAHIHIRTKCHRVS